jgi:hypothetical protein
MEIYFSIDVECYEFMKAVGGERCHFHEFRTLEFNVDVKIEKKHRKEVGRDSFKEGA